MCFYFKTRSNFTWVIPELGAFFKLTPGNLRLFRARANSCSDQINAHRRCANKGKSCVSRDRTAHTWFCLSLMAMGLLSCICVNPSHVPVDAGIYVSFGRTFCCLKSRNKLFRKWSFVENDSDTLIFAGNVLSWDSIHAEKFKKECFEILYKRNNVAILFFWSWQLSNQRFAYFNH